MDKNLNKYFKKNLLSALTAWVTSNSPLDNL